jgi:hypothetical protein
VGEARPLTGEGGWASDDGGPVRDVVGQNLRLAIDALLRDASGTLPRGTARTVAIKTQWVWMKPFFERKAALLEETEDTLVVVPDVMDGFVFAGRQHSRQEVDHGDTGRQEVATRPAACHHRGVRR